MLAGFEGGLNSLQAELQFKKNPPFLKFDFAVCRRARRRGEAMMMTCVGGVGGALLDESRIDLK
jgi:hypothetical protein